MNIFLFMLLALVLGFKHSYDADHLIAVSNILRKVDSIKSSIKIGFSWAVGHMITATVVTILLYYFRESILGMLFSHFEKVVGAMIILLGILSLRDVLMPHLHKHRHEGVSHSHLHIHPKWGANLKKERSHSHKHMFGIGIIHGLASNDELLILFTASLGITTLGGILMGISIFSIGVIIGMIVFSFMFSYPLLRLHSNNIQRLVSFITGTTGVFYGILMLM